MLAPVAYLDVVTQAVEAIADVAEGNLALPVESCPGFDVGRLLEHTGSFCRIVEGRVARDEEWKPASGTWHEASEGVAGDPLGWHRGWSAALCDGLARANPSERIRTWAGHRTRYFWFRRAAQELTIHRWDVEHAVGTTAPIDPRVALDGMDEFLGEFAKRAAPLYGGSGETILFVADDAGPCLAVTTHADRFELNSPSLPDVEARASAEEIYLFLWGRTDASTLEVAGDAAILDRWHDRIRI